MSDTESVPLHALNADPKLDDAMRLLASDAHSFLWHLSMTTQGRALTKVSDISRRMRNLAERFDRLAAEIKRAPTPVEAEAEAKLRAESAEQWAAMSANMAACMAASRR